MAKVQKTYTREFKEEAVRLAQTGSANRSRKSPVRLPISDSSIHQWRKELTQHGEEAFPGSGHQTPLVRAKIAASNENWNASVP